jgi:hypothetical protein
LTKGAKTIVVLHPIFTITIFDACLAIFSIADILIVDFGVSCEAVFMLEKKSLGNSAFLKV